MNDEMAGEDFITQLSNEYGDAIRVLMAEEIDHRQFAIEVAVTAPGLFLKVAKSLPTKAAGHKSSRVEDTEQTKINKYLTSLVKEGKKVEAIKVYRTMTGVGLKEAKDYVDQLSGVTFPSTSYGGPTW